MRTDFLSKYSSMLIKMHVNLYLSVCSVFTVYCVYNVFYQLEWREGADDTNVMCYLVPAAVGYLTIATRCAWLVVTEECRRLFLAALASGWIRVIAFAFFVCLFSYMFVVVVLDMSWTTGKSCLQDFVVRRLEENIIDVKETRPFLLRHSYERVVVGDLEFYRYQGEDGVIQCMKRILWSPIHHPPEFMTKGTWFHNDNEFNYTRIAMTKRYLFFNMTTKLSANESHLTREAYKYGLAVYAISQIVLIKQIQSSDFGVYTCEYPNFLYEYGTGHPLESWAAFLKNIGYLNKTLPARVDEHFLLSSVISASKEIVKGSAAFTEAERKPIVISAAPGAILSFETIYFQHELVEDEINAELFINGAPYHHVGSVWDCSIFLLLYWMIVHGHCSPLDPLCLPPFLRNYKFVNLQLQDAMISVFTVCLGEETFGHYQVEYSRQIFNESLGRYELFTFQHPNDLVVIPRKQELFSGVLTNYTAPEDGSVKSLLSGRLPTHTELHFIRDAAGARASEFRTLETIAVVLTVVLTLFMSVIALAVVCCVGRLTKRRILCCSLGVRNLKTGRNQVIATDQTTVPGDALQRFSRLRFDIFLSYSDFDMEFIANEVLPFLEHRLLQTVCFRERDFPPNLPEVSTLDTAVRNSERYIICLSPDYLQDQFRESLEAKVIVDQAASGPYPPEDTILVVKLVSCRVPTWMRGFTTHDWTTSLSREDHLRRLSRWVFPVWNRPWRHEVQDVFQRGAPLWLLIGVMFIVIGYSMR